MTIDLLPGRGVRLPAPLPELRFGLTEATVRALLARHGELLPEGVRDTFVCGCRWALGFQLPGVGVTLCSDDRDRLRSVTVSRSPGDERPACPVGYLGIDLLGWPAHELVEALRAEGLPVPDPVRGTLHHDPLHLYRHPAPGRKPRHEEPFSFDVVSFCQAADPAGQTDRTDAAEATGQTDRTDAADPAGQTDRTDADEATA